jgi:L-fucose isomerase-like protein
VSYRYLENCHVSDEAFEVGVRDFIASVRVAKAMRTARVGQLGARIDFFWSTIIDEADLLKRFGVEVMPFDMVEVIEGFRKRRAKNDAAYRAELRDLGRIVDLNSVPDDGLINSLALRDEMFDMAERHGLDAIAMQSFNSIQDAVGEGFGLGVSLAEERIPISAETDIHGALSSILIEAASPESVPSFFPEFTSRHPENDNAVLLWHASAPISLRHPDTEFVPILPPWILEGLPATSLQFRLRDGDLTVCRFDGVRGEYRLGVGEGRMVPGPMTREVYGWMEVDNWPVWERRVIEGPYVHHCSAIYERCADTLAQACDWIPGLEVERFDA